MKRIFPVLAGGFVAAILASCSSTDPEAGAHKVGSQEQAGMVHLARGMIAPWDEYIDTLQPNFSMTSDGAAALALPTTSYTQQVVASAFNFGLQLGLPQTTQMLSNGNNVSNGTTTTNGTTTANGSTSTTSSETNATNPGTAPGSPLAAGTMPVASALPVPTGTLKTDAILRYTAATAIYQEIQLLNSYLKDAAFRQDYVPFIVRLPINIEAYARGEPYDVYIDASFFAECSDASGDGIPATVIPLLVTDDLETSQGTNARDSRSFVSNSLPNNITSKYYEKGATS